VVSGVIGSLESSETTFGGGAEVDTKGALAYHGRVLTRSRAMEEDDGARVGGETGSRGVGEPHIGVTKKVGSAERKLHGKQEKEKESSGWNMQCQGYKRCNLIRFVTVKEPIIAG